MIRVEYIRLDALESKKADELLLKWLVLYGVSEPIQLERVYNDGHFHVEGEPTDEESEALLFLEEAELLYDAKPEERDWWYGLTDTAKRRLKRLQ
jgi:hypothetical protein